ncbi:hypothetical protein OH492_29250 [Vibrio chagasii]|nr:hypothetical protein [Vibrio chagasii]
MDTPTVFAPMGQAFEMGQEVEHQVYRTLGDFPDGGLTMIGSGPSLAAKPWLPAVLFTVFVVIVALYGRA